MVDAALFFVEGLDFGLPASAFLGAAAFLTTAGFAAAFVAPPLPVGLAFLVAALLEVDLEGGFEFWGNPRRHQSLTSNVS